MKTQSFCEVLFKFLKTDINLIINCGPCESLVTFCGFSKRQFVIIFLMVFFLRKLIEGEAATGIVVEILLLFRFFISFRMTNVLKSKRLQRIAR